MTQKFFAYHIGVQGQLGRRLNSFFRSRALKLNAAGIQAPRPTDYRPFLRDFVWNTKASFAHQGQALDAFGCPRIYSGISLSNDQALGARRTIYENGEFLFWAEDRVAKLATLFQDHRLIFMLEVENFATFLPKHLAELATEERERISHWPLCDFVWSDLIDSIREVCPDAEIVLAPTEVLEGQMQNIQAKLTTEAVLPKPAIPKRVSKDAIENFQQAISAGLSIPLDEQVADDLYDTLGWDDETRILLSRQYYSEILKLYHSCTLLL